MFNIHPKVQGATGGAAIATIALALFAHFGHPISNGVAQAISVVVLTFGGGWLVKA